jgi:light-regulated signal transduction histidine kinase (bacteriophytochrome)
MLTAVLHRFPALRDLRVQFAALACVTALPFVAGAAYDIWFALQTASGSILPHARSDVVEVRVGGLAIALLVSGLLAALILHRMMPSRAAAAEAAAPGDARALHTLLERRVESRTRELERAVRELESQSHAASQVLREPLGAIEACATLIGRHHGAPLEAEGRALLGRLQESARLLGARLDALGEYARLGHCRLVPQALDMTEVVKAAVEDLRLGAADEARISVAGLPGVPADAALLRQVWRCLIDNALKFSARPRPTEVRIEGSVRHGVAEFRVSDSGVGFDPALEARLFTLFGRLHGAQDYPGIGAGLATVKRIVERHGGFVWADGAPGQGATFGFALPPKIDVNVNVK